MRHEKIIKRENGTQYQLSVSLTVSHYIREGFRYNLSLMSRGKGKRKWVHPTYLNDHEYRALSMEDREEYRKDEITGHITKDEILEAKLELWEKLKPTK